MQALDCRKIQTGELFILYIRVKTDPRRGPASGPRGFLSQFCGLRTALGAGGQLVHTGASQSAASP